jgi:predicted dehydrogenase
MVHQALLGFWMSLICIVIVDKPFAMTSEEADKVIKLSEEKDLILTCFQNRRWVRQLEMLPRA